MPAASGVLGDIAIANLHRTPPTEVDFAKEGRIPPVFIGFGEDTSCGRRARCTTSAGTTAPYRLPNARSSRVGRTPQVRLAGKRSDFAIGANPTSCLLLEPVCGDRRSGVSRILGRWGSVENGARLLRTPAHGHVRVVGGSRWNGSDRPFPAAP